jgi:hypothetical protein
MPANFSPIASQPVSVLRAKRISLLIIAALTGVLASKIAFVDSTAASAQARSISLQLPKAEYQRASAKPTCFEAVVELDEGYGVSGRETRLVCDKAV